MKPTLLIAAALAGYVSAAAADPIAGYDRLEVRAPHRATLVAASIWYPPGAVTYRAPIGDDALFEGTPAYMGPAVAKGRFPLILLSHGSGGNMDKLSWLSSALALRGAMVLAVNHPGSTTGDSSPRRSILFDRRAADLRSALDHVLADPAFASHIDTSRITSLGFSLGGITALNLAGARLNRARYRDYCARLGDQTDCVFLVDKGGVDLDRLPAEFEADMRDPRVGAAIAVDPAFTYALTDASVAAMDLPVLLINLEGEQLRKATDVTASGSNLMGRLPHSEHVAFSPASHFTFLAVCKPAGREILAQEGEDPICDDPVGADRTKVHEAIIERIATFLKL
jgi:predicted dienelactone hydrolase